MSQIIKNLRQDARRIFLAGVEAAAPEIVVNRVLGSRDLTSEIKGRIFLIAVGKAACPMVKEALRHVQGGSLHAAIAVTNYENETKIEGCEVLAAAHPVPDENGIAAAEKVVELLREAKEDDLVLALISGGGSALLPCPAEGMSLADKAAVNDLLLKSGFDINQCNLVRQQLSRLKGGGMARLAAPAQVLALILSDVPGDDLRVVASGPTSPAFATPDEARKLLRSRGLWESLPRAAQTYLEARNKEIQSAETFDHVENVLIGSNSLSVNAAIAEATDDFHVETLQGCLQGDVSEAAAQLMEIALAASPKDHPFAFICGGETTVVVRGDGLGGRNQELAIRFAALAEVSGLKGNWVFLSGGTDGRDGPTESAGGIVDSFSLERMRAGGIDIDDILNKNDSFRALEASGDSLVIGGTGTNVADLQVLLISP